ncbi:MAG TPA: nickel pincer cofactor biosynthesis protein LarC [Ktedonobacteraceae bacterium]|nr:nickel pincer cofactor biosynthesis protein LarC [Ktedonobacteraceae bacterium]
MANERVAYLDCHSGISGDMFLGAALDAGLSLEALRAALATLPLAGYDLAREDFTDKGIRGTRLRVTLAAQEQPPRHFSEITVLITAASLPERVKATSINIFRCLAEAEAVVHGTTVEAVHFHEVGAVDAIVDIVGAAIAVNELGLAQLYASPLPLSSGHVQSAHGLLPVPAPAVLEMLRRVQAPWRPCPVEGEMVTPTGAAILATLARFETPPIAIEHVGYGFGQKRFPWPNCLRLCLGHVPGVMAVGDDQADSDWITVIETNIDNTTGEILGNLMDRLLASGALDVSYTPLQMKKNRPATLITVLCEPKKAEALALLLLRETATLGVRLQQMQRLKAQRSQQTIATPIGPLLVKVKRLGTRVISAAPEYEDCLRLSQERHMPLSDVYDLAQQTIAATIIGNTDL